MKSYSEKLKDPRWQKKRLEILERDEFTCQACNSKEKTLNVHHKSYKKGKNPWEYAKKDLITFCEDCHSKLRGSSKAKEMIVLHWCDLEDLKKYYICDYSTKIPMEKEDKGKVLTRGCLFNKNCDHHHRVFLELE